MSVFRNEIVALERTLLGLEQGFSRAVEIILQSRGKVVVSGVGKSGIIAHKIAATMASTGTPAVFLNAAEALHGDLGVICRGDVLVLLSKSAKTPELCQIMPSVKAIGARIIGIVGDTTTKLAASCDCLLDASISEEACPLGVAPTTSTTVSLVIGDALSVAVMKARNFTREQFAVFHPGGNLGLRLLMTVQQVMVTGSNVPSVSPDSSLKDAIIEMDRCNVGVVVAVSDNCQVLGLLSEGDLRRLIVRGTSLDIPLSSVMTVKPLVVSASATLGEALDLMEGPNKRVYVLPVVDEAARFTGVLRMHDVLRS